MTHQQATHMLVRSLAALTLSLGLATTATAFSSSTCHATYGCHVSIIAVSGSTFVVDASIVWPVGSAPNPLPRRAWIRIDDVDYAAVAITWTLVEHASTCPTEVHGAVAKIASPGPLPPGAIVEVDFGAAVCATALPLVRPESTSGRSQVPDPTDPSVCDDTGICTQLSRNGPQVSGVQLARP